MAMNPLAYAENVVSNFLRYQLTAYPFADQGLYGQMRALLSLEETRRTPLLQGPFISLSQAFRQGARVADLVAEGVLHPHMANLAPYDHVYGHQELAIRAIVSGQTTLVSTGTGSGKTETFLYPIISKCLKLRDANAAPGVVAVIVYPMNALAEDQLQRLRGLLAGTRIPFAMYVGKTPERRADVAGRRLPAGSSSVDYQSALKKARDEGRNEAVYPAEERCSREEIRTPGQQPRILLTNVKQLELLLTRQSDIEQFDHATLDFLVFDEAHTYSGSTGAETAVLIRRLRSFCGRSPEQTVCVGTSATLADRERQEAGREFASRFFGVNAASVEMVTEQYEPDLWARPGHLTPPFRDPARDALHACLAALSKEQPGPAIASFGREQLGWRIDPANWESDLHKHLAASEVVFQIADALKPRARSMSELVEAVGQNVGRDVPEEEILSWLLLGAAARNGERPLLRPVVHAFIRGIAGAVVSFSDVSGTPKLWLSAEDEARDRGKDGAATLPILACGTCGQHYFSEWLNDFRYTKKQPEGGSALADGARVWKPQDQANGGVRVVLFDRLIGADDDDHDPARTAPAWLCRFCGSVHPDRRATCGGCGAAQSLVELRVAAQDPDNPNVLPRCLSCGSAGRAFGGSFREPIRPVRAVAVSDIHVLAQEMLRHAERQRLLVFADNRQEAAFQAGWMRDHARRFRLRALMWERIKQSPLTVGDLGASLDRTLDEDDDLSQALLPDVWEQYEKSAAPQQHVGERRLFLRIQALREVATGVRQRIGLEPWGRLRVSYSGLTAESEEIKSLAVRLKVTPEAAASGLAALLDQFRRSMLLLDRQYFIFSKFWTKDAPEIMRGYVPAFRGVPQGLKLQRDPGDDEGRIKQWRGSRETLVPQIVKRWGIPEADVSEVAQAMWDALVSLRILAPSTLKGSRGNSLPNCSGAYQIDADRLMLHAHSGLWRCRKCRRTYTNEPLKDVCLAWRCDGQIVSEEEDAEAYDLRILDSGSIMVRPREHSAQVPSDEREKIEREFKADSQDGVNVLVCTPTLELGVDIGSLDTVLMRNVPPLPSNYWQRAGRAGRRHRMAVNITYARPATHDRAYFAEPLKMLHGSIEPPRFNLRNDVMVQKHLHAVVLTRLWQLRRTGSHLSDEQREQLVAALTAVFPKQIRNYLFDDTGNVRESLFSVTPLAAVVLEHKADLLGAVQAVFAQRWPDADSAVVSTEMLDASLGSMANALQAVVLRLKRRLDWALTQITRLGLVRQRQGSLKPDEDALFQRCDRLVKKLKGEVRRFKQQAEGYDETNTYGVLAAEGFLPGYGLDTGSVLGTAQVPRYIRGARDYALPRPSAVALREYVPGNLIYANGQRFVPRFYHFKPGQTSTQGGDAAADDVLRFQVDAANQAVVEVGTAQPGIGAGIGAASLRAVPICDVDLAHQSSISDEEEYRFQLAVAVFGYEQGRHGEGTAFRWGSRSVHFRKAVHSRLVNVGPFRRMQGGNGLGYPVCLVCGQSRSPFASDEELKAFKKEHKERHDIEVESTGFYADVIADALTIKDCESPEEAYSLAETLRIGAAQVLDMDREDLEVLILRQPGSQSADAMLYDPMPGGSGLIEQVIARFAEVHAAAKKLVEHCPANCARSCVDCLQTFRNAFYHRYLDRTTAAGRLLEWGDVLVKEHAIPARYPAINPTPGEMPVNRAEALLRHLLQRAGLPDPEWQKQIELGRPLGTTRPDCFWPVEEEPGLCIYLDGMSAHLHGNAATREKDLAIREQLRSLHYDVVVITATQLHDRAAMVQHFHKIARILIGKDRAKSVREDSAWYEIPGPDAV